MRQCFIVVHRNYDEGMNVYAFLDEEEARKNVDADVETTVKSLSELGFNPTVQREGCGGIEVYVADSNIYYEWDIVTSNIR